MLVVLKMNHQGDVHMEAYFFVVATLLAVLPTMVIFKWALNNIRREPEKQQHFFMRFFIYVGIVEAIPIILIVLGLINVQPIAQFDDLFTPLSIVVITYIVAAIYIFMQRVDDIDVNTLQLRMTALAFSSAIPIVSVVGLLLMIE